jgi:hypothetical protein
VKLNLARTHSGPHYADNLFSPESHFERLSSISWKTARKTSGETTPELFPKRIHKPDPHDIS